MAASRCILLAQYFGTSVYVNPALKPTTNSKDLAGNHVDSPDVDERSSDTHVLGWRGASEHELTTMQTERRVKQPIRPAGRSDTPSATFNISRVAT